MITLPVPVEPMLAVLRPQPPAGTVRAWEMKWDGIARVRRFPQAVTRELALTCGSVPGVAVGL
ncbi:hypothetical protein [Amycolatopsis anabasis]|uniref:hypothetical protein n=1 Tax=Amycolatopsis anabasis TaxID=1840409 RepID=UPI00131E767E|nr:hypothetical protein [Amycolatopsis anabasis]